MAGMLLMARGGPLRGAAVSAPRDQITSSCRLFSKVSSSGSGLFHQRWQPADERNLSWLPKTAQHATHIGRLLIHAPCHWYHVPITRTDFSPLYDV